jgi:predicted acylesterase/phospholipase RssA
MSLAGCGTIARTPDALLNTYARQITPLEDPRLDPNEADGLRRFSAGLHGRQDGATGQPRILALSGGGANGAYGAGLLIGWSQRGDRPAFDVVTGVSTGALAAPFAFLGPDWDGALKNAYLNAKTQKIVSARSFAAFVLPGVFSPRTLERLVDDNVTPELLARVAAEHRRGRRLYVATTDLDSGKSVIWDLGLVAQPQDQNALALFRKVLLASASIPGVFPPVLITALNKDGKLTQDMHVDGGVEASFLGIPEGLTRDDHAHPEWGGTQLYIVVNGQVSTPTQVTKGSLRAILTRSVGLSGDAALRARLQTQNAFGRRNGMEVFVSSIPDGVRTSALEFDQPTMRRLLELGAARAARGDAFERLTGSVGLTNPSSGLNATTSKVDAPSISAPGPNGAERANR